MAQRVAAEVLGELLELAPAVAAPGPAQQPGHGLAPAETAFLGVREVPRARDPEQAVTVVRALGAEGGLDLRAQAFCRLAVFVRGLDRVGEFPDGLNAVAGIDDEGRRHEEGVQLVGQGFEPRAFLMPRTPDIVPGIDVRPGGRDLGDIALARLLAQRGDGRVDGEVDAVPGAVLPLDPVRCARRIAAVEGSGDGRSVRHNPDIGHATVRPEVLKERHEVGHSHGRVAPCCAW
jgi:hypothetical protein